jgi:hypothetical protein
LSAAGGRRPVWVPSGRGLDGVLGVLIELGTGVIMVLVWLGGVLAT